MTGNRNDDYEAALHARRPDGQIPKAAILNLAQLELVEDFERRRVQVWFFDPSRHYHRRLGDRSPRELQDTARALLAFAERVQAGWADV